MTTKDKRLDAHKRAPVWSALEDDMLLQGLHLARTREQWTYGNHNEIFASISADMEMATGVRRTIKAVAAHYETLQRKGKRP